MSIQDYVLMHKNVEVLDIRLDDYSGVIVDTGPIADVRHMPPGTMVKGQFIDRDALKGWWMGRTIPSSRSGVRNLLEFLDIPRASAVTTKSFGLSLSDQYWIRPKGLKLSWEDINYFDNGFSDDIGDILFGKDVECGEIDFSSPDITSEGNLKKRWRMIDGKRCLFKGGSGDRCQEVFNEIIASEIAEALGIDHVRYWISWDGSNPYSVCEDFIDRDTEYVPAYHVLREDGRKGSESVYQRYVRICGDLGVDVVPFLDRMIVLDHIIANGDRHLNNFGLVRDADTLEWLGPAPVYDCGSSLGFDLPTSELRMHANDECKPFARAFEKQLALVLSFDWVDVDAVAPVIQDVPRILGTGRDRIDAERTSEIVSLLGDNVSRIARLAESR